LFELTGRRPLLDFEIFSKKDVFWFHVGKRDFATFGPLLENLFEKSTSGSPWKNSCDTHV